MPRLLFLLNVFRPIRSIVINHLISLSTVLGAFLLRCLSDTISVLHLRQPLMDTLLLTTLFSNPPPRSRQHKCEPSCRDDLVREINCLYMPRRTEEWLINVNTKGSQRLSKFMVFLRFSGVQKLSRRDVESGKKFSGEVSNVNLMGMYFTTFSQVFFFDERCLMKTNWLILEHFMPFLWSFGCHTFKELHR